MLEFIEQKNKQGFIQEIFEFRNLVYKIAGENKTIFLDSVEFEIVFGKPGAFSECIASNNLNIDMTFDNVIVNDQNQKVIIDYEWIMNFSIPLDFVIYRAIHGFCVKYNQMIQEIADEEQLMNLMGINREMINKYAIMEKRFINYVYGSEQSYDNILKNYVKEQYDVKSMVQKDTVLSQVFIDEGQGYSEEKCFNFYDQNCNSVLNINVDVGFRNLKKIRFDPLNKAGLVKLYEMNGINRRGEIIKLNKFITNAIYIGDLFVFQSEDPQIIYDTNELNDLITVNFVYKIIVSWEIDGDGYEIINAFSIMEEELRKLTEGRDGLSEKIERLQKEKDSLEFKFEQLQKDDEELLDKIKHLNGIVHQEEEMRGILIDNLHCLENRLNTVINEFELYKLYN